MPETNEHDAEIARQDAIARVAVARERTKQVLAASIAAAVGTPLANALMDGHIFAQEGLRELVMEATSQPLPPTTDNPEPSPQT